MLLAADAGSSTPANLPVERGFTSSLGYMGGAEDHYSQIGDYKEGGNGSLGAESDGDESDDFRSYGKGGGGIVDIWDTDKPGCETASPPRAFLCDKFGIRCAPVTACALRSKRSEPQTGWNELNRVAFAPPYSQR